MNISSYILIKTSFVQILFCYKILLKTRNSAYILYCYLGVLA